MKSATLPEDKLLDLIKSSQKKTCNKSALHYIPKKSSWMLMKVVFFTGLAFTLFSFLPPHFFPKNIELALDKNSEAKKSEIKASGRQPIEPYLALLNNKNLFKNTSEPAEEDRGRVDTEKFSDISLVGILSGENPQAVIEDKKTQKTYYVNKGQRFGDVKIKDIKEGKVILDYKNQNYELYL